MRAPSPFARLPTLQAEDLALAGPVARAGVDGGSRLSLEALEREEIRQAPARNDGQRESRREGARPLAQRVVPAAATLRTLIVCDAR